MPIYLEKSRRNPRRLRAKRRSAKARRNMAFPKPVMIMGERMLADDMNELRELLQLKRELEGGAPQPTAPPSAPSPQAAPPPPSPSAAFYEAAEAAATRGFRTAAQDREQRRSRRTGQAKNRPARDLYTRIAYALGGTKAICSGSPIEDYSPAPYLVGSKEARGPADAQFKGPMMRSSDMGTYKIGGTKTAAAMMSLGMVVTKSDGKLAKKKTIALVKKIAAALSAQGLLPYTRGQSEKLVPYQKEQALAIINGIMEAEGLTFACQLPAAQSNPYRKYFRRRR